MIYSIVGNKIVLEIEIRDSWVNIDYQQISFLEMKNSGERIPLLTYSKNTTPTTKNTKKSINIHQKSSSLLSCYANLCNTILGAGMLGLPNGFAGSGFVGGCIFLFISSFFSAMGLKLLALSAEKTSKKGEASSFYSVANATLPNYGTMLIDFAVAIKCFGVATGYLITIGDCMVDAFQYILSHDDKTFTIHQEHILLSRKFWIIVGLLTIIPISFFKTLNALRCISAFSILIVYALVLVVVLYAQNVLDPCESYINNDIGECKGETYLVTSIPHMIRNLSIFVFSFTCHQNIFTVVNEISNPTRKRIDGVITLTIYTALILYLIISIEGYKTYGDHVYGDILLNYPQTSLIVTSMRLGIVCIMIASYPLQLDPSRRCIISLIYSIKNTFCTSYQEDSKVSDVETHDILESYDTEKASEDDEVELPTLLENQHQQNNRYSYNGQIHISKKDKTNIFKQDVIFIIITIIFLISSLGIAIVVTDLGVILSIVGATGSTIVSYILPGLIYLKLCERWSFLAFMALLQLCLGMVILPSALYFVITSH